jgi:hypothetical protein
MMAYELLRDEFNVIINVPLNIVMPTGRRNEINEIFGFAGAGEGLCISTVSCGRGFLIRGDL